jgi:hypothetical protein
MSGEVKASEAGSFASNYLICAFSFLYVDRKKNALRVCERAVMLLLEDNVIFPDRVIHGMNNG